MTKLMFALWGADLPALLHDPALRERLAAAGATRLQVNQDDEPVGAAMRIPASAEPIRAIVSVWADDLSDDLTGALTDTLVEAVTGPATRVAGWEVEERRPIEPPPVPDGVRADALANVALLRRPAELPEEEWRHRWLVDHTPVAIETQGTFGYVQNIVTAAVTPGAPYVSALVEELFPMAATTDLHAFYGSGGDDAELRARMERMMASVGRFGADRGLDLVPSSRYCWGL